MASATSILPPSTKFATRPPLIPGVGPVLLGSNKVLAIDTPRADRVLSSLPRHPSRFRLRRERGQDNFAPVIGFAYTPRFASPVLEKTRLCSAVDSAWAMTRFSTYPANMALNAPFNLTTQQVAGTTQPAHSPMRSGSIKTFLW